MDKLDAGRCPWCGVPLNVVELEDDDALDPATKAWRAIACDNRECEIRPQSVRVSVDAHQIAKQSREALQKVARHAL